MILKVTGNVSGSMASTMQVHGDKIKCTGTGFLGGRTVNHIKGNYLLYSFR